MVIRNAMTATIQHNYSTTTLSSRVALVSRSRQKHSPLLRSTAGPVAVLSTYPSASNSPYEPERISRWSFVAVADPFGRSRSRF